MSVKGGCLSPKCNVFGVANVVIRPRIADLREVQMIWALILETTTLRGTGEKFPLGGGMIIPMAGGNIVGIPVGIRDILAKIVIPGQLRCLVQ